MTQHNPSYTQSAPRGEQSPTERRGYFGMGIIHSKTHQNVGTLWRSADLMGAAFIFTVGRRYKREPTDTMKTWKHMPLFNFDTLDDLFRHLPLECRVVGVELDDRSEPLNGYRHWERSVYLLGAEDHGLTPDALRRCHDLVQLPGRRSMNVAVAGSIVMYDRFHKPLIRTNSQPAMQVAV